MTGPTPQQKWAGDLAKRIETAGDIPVRPPQHILARLAALLPLTVVEHVDVDFKATENESRMRVDGTITLFTDKLVAMVAVRGMAPMGAGGGDRTIHESTGVDITVVPRSGLLNVAMVEDVTPSQARNDSGSWQAASETGDWPYSGRLTLTYKGLPKPVVLPSGRNISEFEAFLPGLLENWTA